MDDRKIGSSICRRCGRTLKDSISRERGYGPECWNKICKESRRRLFEIRRTHDKE